MIYQHLMWNISLCFTHKIFNLLMCVNFIINNITQSITLLMKNVKCVCLLEKFRFFTCDNWYFLSHFYLNDIKLCVSSLHIFIWYTNKTIFFLKTTIIYFYDFNITHKVQTWVPCDMIVLNEILFVF